MFVTFFRDLIFFIICLIFYDIFLQTGVISLYQASFLIGVVFIYIFIILIMNRNGSSEEQKPKRKQQAKEFMNSPARNELTHLLNSEYHYLPRAQSNEDTASTLYSELSDTISNKSHDIAKSENHDNKQEEEHGSNLLHILEMLCYPFVKTLEFILPVEKLPELSFLIIITIFFVATDFILTVVSMISVYT